MFNGTAILPRSTTRLGRRQLPRLVSLSSYEASHGTEEPVFTAPAFVIGAELDPGTEHSIPVGWSPDPPQAPLPLTDIMTNLDWLALTDPDPEVQRLIREFDLAEYILARSVRDAWDS